MKIDTKALNIQIQQTYGIKHAPEITMETAANNKGYILNINRLDAEFESENEKLKSLNNQNYIFLAIITLLTAFISYAQKDSDIAPITISSAATIYIALVVFIIAKIKESKKNIKENLNQTKSKISAVISNISFDNQK